MRQIRAALAALLLLLPLAAQAQTSAESLSRQDVRVLQAALTLLADYQGLLDGAWGRQSDGALEDYRRAEGLRDSERAIRAVAGAFAAARDRDGWRVLSDPVSRRDYALPERRMTKVRDDDRRVEWRGDGLSLRLGIDTPTSIGARHALVRKRHETGGKPYALEEKNRRITTARSRDGRAVYLMSVRLPSQEWRSFEVEAEAAQHDALELVAASLATGGADLFPEAGGRLERLLAAPLRGRSAEGRREVRRDGLRDGRRDGRRDEREAPAAEETVAAGLRVGPREIVTAAFVLDECRDLRLASGERAEPVGISRSAGIAILRVGAGSEDWIALDGGRDIRDGDEVLATGYRASSRLVGDFVSRAGRVIAAPSRETRDGARIVFRAELVPGMAGGPLLDAGGTVQGIVVSRPGLMRELAASGALPEDTATAVPSREVVRLLDDLGLRQDAEPGRIADRDARSRTLRRATLPLFCTGA